MIKYRPRIHIWAQIIKNNLITEAQWLCPCPKEIPTGNKEPTIMASNSVFVKPLCSLTIIVPSLAIVLLLLLDTSGNICTVATYRNVPALNNMAIPVALYCCRVSLLCCKINERQF